MALSREALFELMCTVLIGVAQLCMFTGYDTQSFIVESVLHSVNIREPWRIDAYAGYYGQATLYFVYTFANLICPTVLHYCGAKWTLVLGSSCFTLYQVGFFYINSYYFYFSQAVVGFGFALFYCGQSDYITGHSTRLSISRNSAMIWAIGCCCIALGAVVLSVIYWMKAEAVTDVTDVVRAVNETLTTTVSSSSSSSHSYRTYSDPEIRLIFGAFTAIALLSNILFACLPSRDVNDSLNSQQAKKTFNGLQEQIGEMFVAMRNPRMLTLAPFFIFWGTFTTYWIGTYPTTLVFTASLAKHIYLVPLYAFGLAFGEVMIGLIITLFARRWSTFGMKPTLGIGCALIVAVFALSLAAVPNSSTMRPTDEDGWLFAPSVSVSLLLGVLMGLADGCMSTARTVVVALAVPNMRAQCFSVSKFYQSLASAVTFFLTPLLSVRLYVLIMAIQLVIAVYCFVKVANATKNMERVAAAEANALPNMMVTEQTEKEKGIEIGA